MSLGLGSLLQEPIIQRAAAKTEKTVVEDGTTKRGSKRLERESSWRVTCGLMLNFH